MSHKTKQTSKEDFVDFPFHNKKKWENVTQILSKKIASIKDLVVLENFKNLTL